MVITHKLKMSLEERDVTQRLEMPQGDVNTRKMELLLFSRQNPWTIPENATVLIQYQKPDGTTGGYDTLPNGEVAWSADGNALIIALAPQVLTVPGCVLLQASLYLEEKILHTFAVEIYVKAPFDNRWAGKNADSQDYCYITGILRGPVVAQPGQILAVAAVDAYGKVTQVEALDTAGLRGENTAVLYTDQVLNEWQKEQARKNIGAGEIPTRTEYTLTRLFNVGAQAFTQQNGIGVYEYGRKQDWLKDSTCFDFSLCVKVDGELYSIAKSDCVCVDMSQDNGQRWSFYCGQIPQSGVLLTVGNGLDPVTSEAKDTLSFACRTGSAESLEVYIAQGNNVEAKPITSVNGRTADWNGDVSLPQTQVLYTEQILTEKQKSRARENIGAAAVGESVDGSTAVRYTLQSLTDLQKVQARENIGAAGELGLQNVESRLLDGALTLKDKKNNDQHTLYSDAGQLYVQNQTAQSAAVKILTDADETQIIEAAKNAALGALPVYNGEVEEV